MIVSGSGLANEPTGVLGRVLGMSESHSGVRMTAEAREVLALCRKEEAEPAVDSLGAGPALLVALHRHGDAFAGRVLASLGVGYEELTERVEVLFSPDDEASPSSAKPPSASSRAEHRWRTSSAPAPEEDVLERAQRQADALGHDHVGTLHLLLGLLDEPGGAAVRALCGVGVEPPDVRRRVLEMVRRGGVPGKETYKLAPQTPQWDDPPRSAR